MRSRWWGSTLIKRSWRTLSLISYTALYLFLALLGAEAYYRIDDEAYQRATLVVFEAPVYESSSTMPYTLAKNINHFQFWRGEYFAHAHTNAEGLREDRDIQIEKPANTFRILTIGDSYVYGFGVERSKTFQAVAESILAERHPERHIEIINMGFAAASDPYSRYIYLRDVALTYKPDVVIVDFNYGSDLGRISENKPYLENGPDGLPKTVDYKPIMIDPNTHLRTDRLRFETEAAGRVFFPESFPLPPLGGLRPRPNLRESIRLISRNLVPYRGDAVCSAIRLCQVVDEYLTLRALRDPKTGLAQFEFHMVPAKPGPISEEFVDAPGQNAEGLVDGYVRAKGWNVAKRLFLGMKKLTDKAQIPLGVLMIPYPYIVEYDPSLGDDQLPAKTILSNQLALAAELDKPSRVFGTFFNANGIAYLHPLKTMHEERISGHRNLYFSFDQHWNEEGQNVVGRLFADWIDSNKWIPDIASQ